METLKQSTKPTDSTEFQTTYRQKTHWMAWLSLKHTRATTAASGCLRQKDTGDGAHKSFQMENESVYVKKYIENHGTETTELNILHKCNTVMIWLLFNPSSLQAATVSVLHFTFSSYSQYPRIIFPFLIKFWLNWSGLDEEPAALLLHTHGLNCHGGRIEIHEASCGLSGKLLKILESLATPEQSNL